MTFRLVLLLFKPVLNRTPFYKMHIKNQGKMVSFAGFELPLQFKGVFSEHNRVRTTVGVFDVSHMGRVEISGKDAESFVNRVTTNDVNSLEPYQAQYSVMCNESGGIIDDLVVYKLLDYFLLVVNGNNRDKDTEWLQAQKNGDIVIKNRTIEIGQLAVQGPKSNTLMERVCNLNLNDLKFYWAREVTIDGIKILISRTGYTGEDGFELYMPNEKAEIIWERLFAAGKEFFLEPVGLGARDTLRLEMGYCLYGNDITENTNPLEAGLGFVVKLSKNSFIGKDKLVQIKEQGIKRKLVGFEMLDDSIPRPGYPIHRTDDKAIGFVTSGTISPSLKKGIGLGYVPVDCSAIGQELEILIRGSHKKAKIVQTPFYKQGTRRG